MFEIKKQNQIICSKAMKANNFMERLFGLAFRKSMGSIDGMIFESKSIHTNFMRFNLDIIFLDKSWNVIRVIKSMKPWRMTKIYWKAKYVIEISSDKRNSVINVGDQLEVKCIS